MTDEFQEKAGSPAEQPPRSISRPIGRTSATEREAITSDRFAFWLSDDIKSCRSLYVWLVQQA